MRLYMIVVFALIPSSDQVTYPCNSSDVCGCSTNSVSASRIVGGEDANAATWGWTVSISIASQYLCGGSIISSSWILTAAHCVNGRTPSDITIYAGSTSRWTGTQSRQVSRIIVHANFNPSSFVYDIALLQLASPLTMTDPYVSQICIPFVNPTILAASESPTGGTYVTAVGWGRLTYDGALPLTIQQVTMQAVDRYASTCSPLISDWQVQFCAGIEDGGKDTCQGDSGGPLMMFTLSNQWVLVGLTSNGVKCGGKDYMGVYTRVAAFEDWLRSNTHGSFTTPRDLTPSDIHPPNNAIPTTRLTFFVYVIYFALILPLVNRDHLLSRT